MGPSSVESLPRTLPQTATKFGPISGGFLRAGMRGEEGGSACSWDVKWVNEQYKKWKETNVNTREVGTTHGLVKLEDSTKRHDLILYRKDGRFKCS